ncbi:MAG: hypothetical protein K9M84_06630 [Spirochaetia bacterium]|nr:hypothetical protein [Spirochaetia bacterium]MCF7941267.1 hypothetical protein [Spirochaetia bacterium]
MRTSLSKGAILLSALVLITSLAGCSKEQPAAPEPAAAPKTSAAVTAEPGSYADGFYFAQEDGFSSSGWKYTAAIEVKDGKIISAEWDGANTSAGYPKKVVSQMGDYNMVKFGGAQSEWHEQAAKAEAYLLQTQDPAAIEYTDADGHTDAIAGVSIHVVEFFELAQKALEAGPVGRGPYADGYYHAEEDQFAENGWRYSSDLTVLGGYIVAANWNGANRDGGTDKKTRSEDGQYNMVKFGGAIAEWHEQAAKAEAYLLQTQDPAAIEYTDAEGHTDAIAGVSIHVVEFFELAQEALEAGPAERGPYADGHYHAEAAEFPESGWKATVDLTVLGGNIFAVNWSAVNEAGEDKKTTSIEGNYNMVKFGGAIAEWHEQAYAVEDYLLEVQDPTAITYSDDEGNTDAISGATIHVSEFFTLAEQALAAGPVE